jgi:hypothetical protein
MRRNNENSAAVDSAGDLEWRESATKVLAILNAGDCGLDHRN